MEGREKKKTWTTVMMLLPLGAYPLYIFVGSLVDLPVLWRQPSLAASTHPPSLPLWGAHQASTISVSPVWLRQEWHWLFHRTYFCLHTLGLHLFMALIPPIAHPSPPGSFVQTVPGGRWAAHQPQDFCILSSAAGRILRVATHAALTASPQALLWPCQIQWLEKPL